MRTQYLSDLGPRIEMVTCPDCSAHSLRLPDGPKLLERSCPVDAWLICASCLVDVMHATITRDGALPCHAAAGIV